MKKRCSKFSMALTVCLFLLSAHCDIVAGDTKNTPKVVSRVVSRDGVTYIEANNRPYLFYGIQIRIDDYLAGNITPGNMSKCEEYFKRAREMNFETVIVPVPWDYIQFKKNEFDFDGYFSYILSYANKYNLQLHILWFGSNVCGWPSEAPRFITDDKKTFKRIKGKYPDDYPFDFSSQQLLELEKEALARLMDYVYLHDSENRVIMIQIANEPDHFGIIADWRPDLSGIEWVGGQKEAIITMLDKLGQVVHKSDYRIVTRYNALGTTKPGDALRVFNTEGIDIVGQDVYSYELGEAFSGSQVNFLELSAAFDFPGNVNHIPENGAQYANSINLALASFNEARGYLMYELRSTEGKNEYDLGLYRKSTIKRDQWIVRSGKRSVHYEFDGSDRKKKEVSGDEVALFNRLIYKADQHITLAGKDRSTVFNLDNRAKKTYEVKELGPVSIEYTSDNGSEAMVLMLDKKTFVILNMYEGTTFTFSKKIAAASAGYFNEDNRWTAEKKLSLSSGNKQIQAGTCQAILVILEQ